MDIFRNKLTLDSGSKKEPVILKSKTNYQIIVMVNDNDIITGTHTGLLMVGPDIFQIFDPNGSFHYPTISGGSLRLFPSDNRDERIDLYKCYLLEQLTNGKGVFVYKFHVTKQEFFQIEDRILNEEGCSGVWNCSICTSNAIYGIGPFKNLPSNIRFPSNLKKELDKLTKPIIIKADN